MRRPFWGPSGGPFERWVSVLRGDFGLLFACLRARYWRLRLRLRVRLCPFVPWPNGLTINYILFGIFYSGLSIRNFLLGVFCSTCALSTHAHPCPSVPCPVGRRERILCYSTITFGRLLVGFWRLNS